jgi:hypothetical protein
MRFLPGDYLDVAVILPESASATPGGHGVGPGLHIKGAVAAAANSLNGGGVRGPPSADRLGPGAGAG